MGSVLAYEAQRTQPAARHVTSITVEAARELGLKEGAEVTAIVKASDVILGVS